MNKLYGILFLLGCFSLSTRRAAAQTDLIRCTNNAARSWWDVLDYHLNVDLTDTVTFRIYGSCTVMAKVIHMPADSLQLDLAAPLRVTGVTFEKESRPIHRDGSAFFIPGPFSSLAIGDTFRLSVTYEGIPAESEHAPWSSGFIHAKDHTGRPWWAVACQEEGASAWFPCKNFQGDEPEQATTSFTVPAGFSAIGNGRLVSEKKGTDGKTVTYSWHVANPINNYDITFYMGRYMHWKDTFNGIKGTLDLDYYVLPQDALAARKQFVQVKQMLQCFESAFGPYPFYEDGYKLVQAPYLGMEHQSAVAYGNHFANGYLGRDRSKSGVGMLFDFIIVHESGHEWFGNSITAYDRADSWIHEGFTSYAETIFAECIAGREKAFAYQQGKRRTIRNDSPVEGLFNQCDGGSGDQYDKAGFMIHMIRVILNDDAKFYAMLKSMNRQYYHQIVTGKEIEDFISSYAGKDFSRLFEQYLRRRDLPVLVLAPQKNGTLAYRWEHCVPGFDMPVLWKDGSAEHWLYPATATKYLKNTRLTRADQISRDFLITIDLQ